MEESGELYRELIEQMKGMVEMGEEISPDREDAHRMADGILCRWLKHLGYTKLVEMFDDVRKWYA